MSDSILGALEQDLALAMANGGLAGRETLAAVARDLALRLELEDDADTAATLARALHAVLLDLPLAKTGDEWEDFLNDLSQPTQGGDT